MSTDATVHLPGSSRPVPASTYRVQLHAGFTFADLADQVDYLAALGITHVYLSPILQAAPGSTHGYDVVDHTGLSVDLGGDVGFGRLCAALDEHGLGSIVDVVPNHAALPTPALLNAAFWSVLRDGRESPYATWFDVDWAAQGDRILVPVLGRRLGDVLAAGELRLDSLHGQPVLRYYDHVFPVRPGTERLPLAELMDRQAYRLAYWRVADEELNYRRFFNISTLAALRVEDRDVFARTHEVLLKLVADGKIDGLRIDHPDGLAAPGAYLARLATESDRSWVVVEKILEGDERLPADWKCAGTTGYDALLRVGGLLLDPAGARPLLDLYTELTGAPENFHDVVYEAKRHVVRDVLGAEVTRLTALLTTISRESEALRDHTRPAFTEALIELLVQVNVYRAYVTPGQNATPEAVTELDRASAAAGQRLPEHRHATLDVVRDLALGRYGRSADKDEFVVRFQQTCGPVMAKGVEDTAFYRWFRLSSLNEVGGDPARFGVSPQEFHDWCMLLQRTWPLTMTTLSTHDTKRSEDVRARLAVLSELPEEWGRTLTSWRARSAAYRSKLLDANTEYLLWQTLVGAWPIEGNRLTGYLEKATREAKWLTTWVDPDPAYDAAVREFAESVLGDDALVGEVATFVRWLEPHTRVNVLSQKLLQLAMPGVPDVYQGTELLNLSLVDPDNRRPVNYATRRELLAALDAGTPAEGIDAEKLLVTSRALRVRRQHPEWFGVDAAYVPVQTTSAHVVAFARGDSVVAIASRLSAALQRTGGWQGATVELPPGTWRDALTGRVWAGGAGALADLLHALPVALLVRD